MSYSCTYSLFSHYAMPHCDERILGLQLLCNVCKASRHIHVRILHFCVVKSLRYRNAVWTWVVHANFLLLVGFMPSNSKAVNSDACFLKISLSLITSVPIQTAEIIQIWQLWPYWLLLNIAFEALHKQCHHDPLAPMLFCFDHPLRPRPRKPISTWDSQ